MVLPRRLVFIACALLAALPAAGMAPEAPECGGELPFALNAAVAPSGRYGVPGVEALAQDLFTGLYRDRSPCADSRGLQVNLAVGSEYHVLHWLEEGSVDVALVSDLSLELLRRAEVDLLEIDLAEIDFAAQELPEDLPEELAETLPERILPRWRPTLRAVAHPGGSGGRAPRRTEEPAVRLVELEEWLASGLGDDPAALAAVLRGGEERCPVLDPEGDPRVRLTLPSHLSTAGFVQPVAAARERLGPRLEALREGWRGVEGERLHEAGEACFWRRYFDHVCFRLQEQRIGEGAEEGGGHGADACSVRWSAEAKERPLVEVRIGREAVSFSDADSVDGAAGAVSAGDHGAGAAGLSGHSRDHLVIRRGAAEVIFGSDAFPPAEGGVPSPVRALIDGASRPRGLGEGPELFEAFRAMAVPEPFLGTRTFSFTAREAAELVAMHQRLSDRRRLSLVLPGGGVKAAFQSRLLEGLYRDGVLRNAGVGAAEGAAGVRVDSVVGTSGGALLGYFVARLDAEGPYELSEILWQRPATSGNGETVYLNAFDVFGSTDLPRYLSLIVIYLVFAGALAACSLRHRGWLAPERPGTGDSALRPSIRPGLSVLLLSVLVLTPLLVRWLNGPASVEHVPEFEGLLYAVLVGLAVFADQSLVHGPRPEGPPPRRRVWSPPGALTSVGAALIVLPVVVKLLVPATTGCGQEDGAWIRRLDCPVTTGEGYLLLGAVAAGLMLSAVRRDSGVVGLAAGAGWFTLAFVGGTAAALGMLRWTPEPVLAVLDAVPLLFLALGMVLLTVGLARRAGAAGARGSGGGRRLARSYAWLGDRLSRLWGLPGGRRVVVAVAPVVACLVVLDLSRPEARTFLETPLLQLAGTASKLAAPRGGLAVCLGAVLVMMGGFLVLHHRRNRYRLERTREFVDGVVFVVLGLALAVYVALGAMIFAVGRADRGGWLPDSPLAERLTELSLFELTPAFWVGLAATSLVGSVVLVGWARLADPDGRGGRFHRVGARVRDSLEYLCSRHPNGHVISRRFVRLGLFAVGALLWWNFVLAPALYGNRVAWRYLQAAEDRFEAADCRSQGIPEVLCGDPGRPPSSHRLTARYLAPANALGATADGTRFVLAVAGDDRCPPVPSSPGVVWRIFHAVQDPDEHSTEGPHACQDLLLAEEAQREALMDYVFASGSPFPAFPARRVPVDDGRREALVDGGYSNNVPLQAAADLGSAQALVVHSSHPVPRPGEPGLLATLGGPLVDDLPRLFGFLYRRSQQLDRRSRSRLFVVSLAPPHRPDWPLLTDFRSKTVEWMVREADAAAGQRIGLVESWGPPGFPLGVTVPPEGAEGRR